MPNYSSGNVAIACCPRCGLRWDYRSLRIEADTMLRVCDDCLDSPDPYRRLLIKPDNIALQYPFPDQSLED